MQLYIKEQSQHKTYVNTTFGFKYTRCKILKNTTIKQQIKMTLMSLMMMMMFLIFGTPCRQLEIIILDIWNKKTGKDEYFVP